MPATPNVLKTKAVDMVMVDIEYDTRDFQLERCRRGSWQRCAKSLMMMLRPDYNFPPKLCARGCAEFCIGSARLIRCVQSFRVSGEKSIPFEIVWLICGVIRSGFLFANEQS